MTDDEVLTDLESFNNAMVHFKEAVDSRGNEFRCFSFSFCSNDGFFNVDLEQMPMIFNRLLAILKHIIQTYRLIDSVDVLEYAAKLIHLLQGSTN